MNYFRGDIYEYRTNSNMMRLALVISDESRKGEQFISVIVLIDKPMGQYCVPIKTKMGQYFCDCKIASYTNEAKLGEFIGSVSDETQKMVDEMLVKSLGLSKVCVAAAEPIKPVEVSVKPISMELLEAQTEAKTYKKMYEELLARVTGGVLSAKE